MKEEDCFVLGRVTKPHGYKGEVVFFIDADEPDAYRDLDSVWLKVGDRLIPHFIDSIRTHNTGDKFVVRFDGVDTEAKAKAISSAQAFAPLSLLPQLDSDAFYLHEVDGWEVHDLQNGSALGTIQRVLDYAMYPILEVEIEGREVLIPLPAEVGIRVERSMRTLHVDLPNGLLEAYLGKDNESGEDWDGDGAHAVD